MTTYDERERAFEAKFAHDSDLKFKIMSRRNKMLGEWAAQRMGLSGAAVADYVRAVLKAEVAGPGDAGVAMKVKADLVAKGITVSDAELGKTMGDLLTKAVAEFPSSN